MFTKKNYVAIHLMFLFVGIVFENQLFHDGFQWP